VVVAVIAVRMVQVRRRDSRRDPVRHRFMAAPGRERGRLVTPQPGVHSLRIFGAHFELMLVYMIAVRMMQMSHADNHVIVVLDRSMSTVRAMLMVVVSVMWLLQVLMWMPWLKHSRQLGRPNAQRVDRRDSAAP